MALEKYKHYSELDFNHKSWDLEERGIWKKWEIYHPCKGTVKQSLGIIL